MTDIVTDLFEKALLDGGVFTKLKPNERAIELPDGRVMIVEIVPDPSPQQVTLTLGSRKD